MVTFGSGDSDSFSYDPNTGWMTQYKYNVNGQAVVGNLTWNANGTLGSLATTDPFNAANTQNCTYSYDDLARLASGNCGSSVWAQTFSYDAFGNITKTGSEQFQPGYNWQTNQMSSGASYDSCLADYETIGRAASICLLHDINDKFVRANPTFKGGVPKLWKKLLASELVSRSVFASDVFEYLDHSEGDRIMGIGMIVRDGAIKRQDASLWDRIVKRRIRILRSIMRVGQAEVA